MAEPMMTLGEHRTRDCAAACSRRPAWSRHIAVVAALLATTFVPLTASAQSIGLPCYVVMDDVAPFSGEVARLASGGIDLGAPTSRSFSVEGVAYQTFQSGSLRWNATEAQASLLSPDEAPPIPLAARRLTFAGDPASPQIPGATVTAGSAAVCITPMGERPRGATFGPVTCRAPLNTFGRGSFGVTTDSDANQFSFGLPDNYHGEGAYEQPAIALISTTLQFFDLVDPSAAKISTGLLGQTAQALFGPTRVAPTGAAGSVDGWTGTFYYVDDAGTAVVGTFDCQRPSTPPATAPPPPIAAGTTATVQVSPRSGGPMSLTYGNGGCSVLGDEWIAVWRSTTSVAQFELHVAGYTGPGTYQSGGGANALTLIAVGPDARGVRVEQGLTITASAGGTSGDFRYGGGDPAADGGDFGPLDSISGSFSCESRPF